MKGHRILFTLGLVALIGVAAYGTVLVRRGFSARGTPSTIETLLATGARKLAVPANYRHLRNPLLDSQENIDAAMEHFADHCATCHGNDGSGDTMFGRGLYPKPPDMRKAETQAKSDGDANLSFAKTAWSHSTKQPNKRQN